MRKKSHSVVIAVVGLMTALAGWAVSSPPLSTPDEILHIANIWCANEPDGEECIDKSNNKDGELIGTFGYAVQSCFWRKPTLPANCGESTGESSSFLLYQSGTYYHPGFQKVMHQFVGKDGPLSILRMKLFNVSVFAALSLFVLLCLPLVLARSWLTALAVTVSPFSIWLIASINPSGWGITGVAMVWVLLTFVILQVRSQRGIRPVSHLPMAAAVIGLLVATFMSFQARRDVMLFALVVTAVTVFFEVITPLLGRASTRTKRIAIAVGFPVVLVVVGLAAHQGVLGFALRSDLQALSPDGPTVSVWFTNWITHFPAVFLDAYGAAGLGENDIGISKLVMIVSMVVVGGIVMFASQQGSMRQLSSAVLLTFSFVAILWFASIELDLYNVPGRYVMPLFPVIIGTYVYYSRSSVQLFDILRLRYIAIGLLGIANALGLYAVIERYSAGSSAGIRVIPVRFDEWWWSFLPVGPNGVVVLGSVGWVVFLVYAFRLLDERKEWEVTR